MRREQYLTERQGAQPSRAVGLMDETVPGSDVVASGRVSKIGSGVPMINQEKKKIQPGTQSR